MHTDNSPTNSPAAVVRVDQLHKNFGDKRVLRGVDLEIPPGTALGLSGRNGSGKTTLIKCALGLLRPSSGSVSVLGDNAWDLSSDSKARLGYVPQEVTSYPWMRVRQVIAYTAAFYPTWNQPLVDDLCRRWQLPLEDRVGLLSVGQLQTLGIVLAMGHEPELLVLDEPVAALDPAARRQFLKVLLETLTATSAHAHRTILFSTHITSDLERIASRVAVLKAGRIAFCGELSEYETRVQVSAWDRSTRSVRMEGRQIGALQKKRSWWLTSWCIDKWHDRIPVRCAAGTVSGSVLYHYGYRALPGWIHATALAFFILFFFSLCLAKGIFGHQGTGTPIGIAFLVLQFSVVLPAITGHTLLLQRWPRLGQELLLPHSRADMIDGLLGALRRDALLLFMTMQMATVALAAGWWPHLLVPGAVVAYLSLAIGSALLGTAVAFWVASRYRDSLGGALIALLIMPLLGVFALWMSWRETSGDGPFWLVAAVLIASGQLVMRRARRSWNTVELGA